jgi:Family of unknown function (DUF5681)
MNEDENGSAVGPEMAAHIDRIRDNVIFGTGYKRPPRAHQFRKGQSGNPKGRPVKAKSLKPMAMMTAHDTDVMAELTKRDTILEKGKKVEVSRRQLLLGAQSSLGAKGNALALRNALAMSDTAEQRALAQAAYEKARQAEHYDYCVNLKAAQQRAWDEFLATGILPERPFPHPDDILIDTLHRTVQFRGPLDVEDLPTYVGLRIKRDVALLTLMTMDDGPGYNRRRGTQYLLSDTLNGRLPLAWQLDDNQKVARACDFQRLSPKGLEIERDILDEMEARLQLPVSRAPGTGSKKLDRAFERHAKRAGHASFAAMSDALEAERKSRLTPHIRQAAHERLEAMFQISLANERTRAARKAERNADQPLYEKRRLRVV